MRFILRLPGPILTVAVAGCALVAAGCGGTSGSSSSAPAKLSFSLGSASVIVAQDGFPVTLPITVTGPVGTETVTVGNLPTGVTETFTPVSGGPSGTLTFFGNGTTPAGSYSITVTVSLAGQSQSQGLTLVSAVVVKVGGTQDTTLGVKGVLKQFMSTSFQIA